MNEKKKTGKSRQLQLKKWESKFKWEKPNARTYRVIEVYDTQKEIIDGRINNGGARVGAGAKVKNSTEFTILFNQFVKDNMNKNKYYQECSMYGLSIYFSNDEINKFFGLYRNIYEAIQTDNNGNLIDEKVDRYVFNQISEKVREKSRSWILNKISKYPNVVLSKELLAYRKEKHHGKHETLRREDLLPKFDEYQNEYLKSKNAKTIRYIFNKGLWNDMNIYVTNKLNNYLFESKNYMCDEYENYKKFHKLDYNPEEIMNFNFANVKKARESLNKKICKEIYDFFLKRNKEMYEFVEVFDNEYKFNENEQMAPYIYIIEKYIKL